MSVNDQADGFFDTWYCASESDGTECTCGATLEPKGDEHKGRIIEHEKDVYDLTHGKIGFRLAKGFSMMYRSEH